MTFDRHALFERMRALWPSVIDLSGEVFDGRRVSGLQVLNELYRAIEASTPANDYWREIGAWAFHQALWSSAKDRPPEATTPVQPSAVTFNAFDQKMRLNLADPCWAAERDIYAA